jgi:hypothetical protein
MYPINNIEARRYLFWILFFPPGRKCGCVVTKARIFTMGTPFRAASIQTQLLTKLDAIVKRLIFEIGDREIAAGGEFLCTIFTTGSVVAAY